MDPWLTVVIAIITGLAGVAASTGFWEYRIYKKKKEDSDAPKNKLLLGLAHDRIMCLCGFYQGRGFVTQDEYADLNKYLFEPYKEEGGNGSAERAMNNLAGIISYNSVTISKEEYEEYIQMTKKEMPDGLDIHN